MKADLEAVASGFHGFLLVPSPSPPGPMLTHESRRKEERKVAVAEPDVHPASPVGRMSVPPLTLAFPSSRLAMCDMRGQAPDRRQAR